MINTQYRKGDGGSGPAGMARSIVWLLTCVALGIGGGIPNVKRQHEKIQSGPSLPETEGRLGKGGKNVRTAANN